MPQNLLVINAEFGETRVALIENGMLAELLVERETRTTKLGNIYLGRVSRVLPGMQAAFVEIGLERAAFLHVHDMVPPDDFDQFFSEPIGKNVGSDIPPDGAKGTTPSRVSRSTPIRDVLREGQEIIVQVSKDPIGTKGARVSNLVSLPGRYVVYMPTIDHIGVSRRIGSDEERLRLREVIDSMRPPKGGLIVRTVAEGLTRGHLKAEIGYLVRLWGDVLHKRESAKAPKCLYAELSLSLRAARDLFSDTVEEVVVDNLDQWKQLCEFANSFMPDRVKDIHHYAEREPIFDAYGIEDEIRRALGRKIPLPSGGSLIIDQAEALTAIDVNTGRFVGKGSKDLEETFLKTNLEAVEEIAYQLRLRNLGGLIVLDMIDMDRADNREKVRRRLADLLRSDKAQTTINSISEFGLIEMTRKRTRESLGRLLHEPCFYCDGTGHLQSKATIAHEVLRQVRREAAYARGASLVVRAHPAVVEVLREEKRSALASLAKDVGREIELSSQRDFHIEQFDIQGK